MHAYGTVRRTMLFQFFIRFCLRREQVFTAVNHCRDASSSPVIERYAVSSLARLVPLRYFCVIFDVEQLFHFVRCLLPFAVRHCSIYQLPLINPGPFHSRNDILRSAQKLTESHLHLSNDAKNGEMKKTKIPAIAEGPRDASCQLKSCQLLHCMHNSTRKIQFEKASNR